MVRQSGGKTERFHDSPPVNEAKIPHPERHGLKLKVHLRLELLLQPIAVEPEEALNAVVVVVLRVLPRELDEVLVHSLVIVITHEVAPEAE